MALGAVVDEGRFQPWLDAGDAALINVGFFLLPGGSFDIEVVEFLAVHEGHAQLFLLSRVNQHAFHGKIPRAQPLPRVTRLSPGRRWNGASPKDVIRVGAGRHAPRNGDRSAGSAVKSRSKRMG